MKAHAGVCLALPSASACSLPVCAFVQVPVEDDGGAAAAGVAAAGLLSGDTHHGSGTHTDAWPAASICVGHVRARLDMSVEQTR